MNHYPHHIGDYLKDTAHLDPAEDGIYRRMIDLYYTQEGPLSLDVAALCRRLRLTPSKYSATVQNLLAEFFDETPNGWRQERCDIEIEKYQAKASANRQNGSRGGRPSKTQQEPKNNPSGYQSETQTITQNNLNQNQNQNQEPIKQRRAQGACPRPEEIPETVWNDFLAIRKAKRAPLTQTALDGIRTEADRAGYSLTQAIETCCMRGWQGFEAKWVEKDLPREFGKTSQGIALLEQMKG